MKVLIAGSNGLDNYYKLIDKAIEFAKLDKTKFKTIACIDNLVKLWAENGFFKVKKFEAKWLDLDAEGAIIRTGKDGHEYNARAAFNRNNEVTKYANCLVVIYKRGDTAMEHLIECFEEAKKKVYVYEV